jgi:PAS domain S-box-containing protein
MIRSTSLLMNKAQPLPLDQEINRLKAENAALTDLQLDKDRFQQDYENSQIRFKTVFEQSAHGNKLINADLEIIKVNKALTKLLGYSKKELLGTRITDIAHPDFVKHWEKLQHKLWTANKPFFCVDTCLVKKDKTPIWCHVTSILLKDNGETLGYTILENISERKASEQNLKEANRRELLLQKQLLEATINAQETERLHVAEDVHNSLAQSLYAVKLRLSRIDFETPEKKSENALAVENANDVLSDCIKECRRISYSLMPSVLERFGLEAAIEDICKRHNGTINFKSHCLGFQQRLLKLLEVAIYRIAEELAANVVKHAAATNASIKLSFKKPDIFITVEDNGVGLNMLDLKDSNIGIRSIENKIHLLNGKMDIQSTPGGGTIISIQFSTSSF